MQSFTRQEVAKFDGKNGRPAYVIVNGNVLDVTKFAPLHPGGELVLTDEAGKDVTKLFYSLHRHEVLEKRLQRLKVGSLKDYDAKNDPPAWTDISKVPYGEIDMTNSPYYNASHARFRAVCRKFIWESGLYEWSDAAESSNEAPSRELFEKMGKSGYLSLCVGRGEHLNRIPEPNLWSMAGMKASEVDLFHLAVLAHERCRMMCPGAEDGIVSGISIGLGPVMHFGPKWMQGELVQDILLGKKIICLAITEPYAGSDVAGVKTTAVKSADGSQYVLNGAKKWITNSTFADFYTTLTRVVSHDGKDLGTSMFLVAKGEGVTVRPIPTDYSLSAGTGLISFENVVVPAANLLGKEGEGFAITMHNFNMERWGICAMVTMRSLRVIEETMLWANQREAFGKKLIDQPVVRNRLGDMISDHQVVLAQFEKLTHLYNTLNRKQQNAQLGGPTGLLKYRATKMSQNVADGAAHIFGGRGVTRTGMGKNIQRNQKSHRLAAIYGGDEAIVLDLGVKQALKTFPKNAKL